MQVIDTSTVQRLRRIKALGAASILYPSANHTRFEHSLGVMHLAGVVGKTLNLSEDEIKKIRLAALLHDIGHFPFSHVLEEISIKYKEKKHEDYVLELIESSELASILKKERIDPAEIASIASGNSESYLGSIIAGDFDVDRMDYLVRDAHHTGVAYGIIDLNRIINTLKIQDNTLVIESGGIMAIESLLVARVHMFQAVYLHKVARIVGLMIKRAAEKLIEDEKLDTSDLLKMDDFDFIALLRSSEGYPKNIMTRIDNRDLYKCAFSKSFLEINKYNVLSLYNNEKRIRHLEEELARRIKIDPDEIIIDIFLPPKLEETNIKVLNKGEIFSFGELSKIALSLKNLDFYGKMNIYCPKESKKDIKPVIERVMGEYIRE